MTSIPILVIVLPTSMVLLALGVFLIYIWVRFAPVIGRIFEEPPVFQPLRVTPELDGEVVRFPTADGFNLAGTYHRCRTEPRVGIVVFCHEYLGDRASVEAYAEPLLDLGFDLFAYDARNHGESESDPSYQPIQWVSGADERDLRAALAYVGSRADRDPAGVALFGISRGANVALCIAAEDPTVWGVVTDGAFPTRGTMLSYILRWAEIYVGTDSMVARMPVWMFAFAGWTGRYRTEKRLGMRFSDVEKAVSRLAPRPLLMIHGERDNYIGPEIARSLFDHAGEPKELWIVPEAKHNRCREIDPEGYQDRIGSFLLRFAPRSTGVAGAVPVAGYEAARTKSRGAAPTASRPSPAGVAR